MALVRDRPNRRKEIARRYRRRKSKVDVRAIRLRELVTPFRYRHGNDELPFDTSGEGAMFILACHLRWLAGDPHRRIRSAIDMRAPWMDPKERDRIIERAMGKPRKWTATKLGLKLGLTEAERQALKITTFRSIDGPTPKERKRARDRANATRKRRAAGAVPRAEYLAKSKEAHKPWKALNISRAKYYRLIARAPTRESCSADVRQVRRHHTRPLLGAMDLSHGPLPIRLGALAAAIRAKTTGGTGAV